VYRAIDQFDQVIDVFVSPRRDITAARRFFERVIAMTKVAPVEVVTDRAARYPVVLNELLQRRGIEPSSTPTTASSATTAD
jgi:transposase-like protein